MGVSECVCGQDYEVVENDGDWEVACPNHEGHRRVFAVGDTREAALLALTERHDEAGCTPEENKLIRHLLGMGFDEIKRRLARKGSGPLIYLAHPIRPVEEETVESNLEAVTCIYRALLAEGYTVIAPYILPILKGWENDHNEEDREEGLRRAREYAKWAGLVLLTGPRVSAGMAVEANAASRVLNCTGLDVKWIVAGLGAWLVEWHL